MKLTEQEIQRERTYRYEEGLAILCGADKPTPEQDAIARTEAGKWVSDYAASMTDPLLL